MGAAERRKRRERRLRREKARRGPQTPSQSRQLDGIAGSHPAEDYELAGRTLRRRKRNDRERARSDDSEQTAKVMFGHDQLKKLSEPVIKRAEKNRKKNERKTKR